MQSDRRRRWALIPALVLAAAGCSAATSPTPTTAPAPTATASPTASGPAESPGPISPIPTGCADTASGKASAPRVTIADITTQTYADYDVVIFDFDRALPEYTVKVASPPFTRDPSGQPLEVQGSAFVALTFRGASIVDEEFQPVYEGTTDLIPRLPRIQEIILAGDFEAVSNWVVGLAAPGCLAVQAFQGNRLVIAFLDAP